LINLSSYLLKQENMMKQHNDNIEAEISKTMQALDEIQPIKVDHLFRARLMQRVAHECTPKTTGSHVAQRRLDYRLAVMSLLFVINLGSALVSIQQSTEQPTTSISKAPNNQSDDYITQEFAYYDQTASYGDQAP